MVASKIRYSKRNGLSHLAASRRMETLPIATAFCPRHVAKATPGVAPDVGRQSGRSSTCRSLTRTPFLTGTALNVASLPTKIHSTRDSIVRCEATEKRPLVAVTGATGLVGSSLVARLTSQGYGVKVLTRNVDRAKSILPYPSIQFVSPLNWDSEICGCDAVVNLAGEPIATRWSPDVKAEIKRSRVETTRGIARAINACPDASRPRVLVNSSAIGYYGTSLVASMVESSPSGSDYLAEICLEWEAAAQETQSPTRVVILRTGLVLAKEGGVLGLMIPVFNLFAGGPLGSGQQWVSWIHRDDLVNLFISAINEEKYSGTYNATAPNPVRMGDFCSALGRAMGRPSWVPVPEFAMQTLLGEGALLVVEGQRVLPSKTQDAGFEFEFKDVTSALQNLM